MITRVDFIAERKEDGKKFDVLIGTADLTGDTPRYYIGITENRNSGWLLEIIDGMDNFHERYEIISIG